MTRFRDVIGLSASSPALVTNSRRDARYKGACVCELRASCVAASGQRTTPPGDHAVPYPPVARPYPALPCPARRGDAMRTADVPGIGLGMRIGFGRAGGREERSGRLGRKAERKGGVEGVSGGMGGSGGGRGRRFRGDGRFSMVGSMLGRCSIRYLMR